MKAFDLALKDLLQSFRSAFALVMMFVVPILITGLIHLAFGSLGGDGGFEIPLTRVQVVNLDRTSPESGGFVVGQMLLDTLKNEQFGGFLQVAEATSAQEAREAVDCQEADIAIIIPEDLTAAVFSEGGRGSVVLYHDPTLTLGPAIAGGLVGGFLDGFAGSRIALQVLSQQFAERGMTVDDELWQRVVQQYSDWARAQGKDLQMGELSFLKVRSVAGQAEPVSPIAGMIGAIMAGMLINFAFFTGASGAQSIIKEDEEGTLARLFTTPTPRVVILKGKLYAVFVMLVVQVLVLMLASGLIFGIHWGKPLPVMLVVVGLVIVAAGSGVFLMCFLKSTRQAGAVMGGVVTLTSMAGGLFTPALPNLPAFYDRVTLFTPQGWALRGWRAALSGGGVEDVLLPVIVMSALGIALFSVGAHFFRKRFA